MSVPSVERVPRLKLSLVGETEVSYFGVAQTRPSTTLKWSAFIPGVTQRRPGLFFLSWQINMLEDLYLAYLSDRIWI